MSALRGFVVLCFLILLQITAYAQRPRIIDGNRTASVTPQWIHCNGIGYMLFIQTTISTGGYTINWGFETF